jgi:hypothetical protein
MINWKAPGRDHTANFQLKQLTATYKYLATLLTRKKHSYSDKLKQQKTKK